MHSIVCFLHFVFKCLKHIFFVVIFGVDNCLLSLFGLIVLFLQDLKLKVFVSWPVERRYYTEYCKNVLCVWAQGKQGRR